MINILEVRPNPKSKANGIDTYCQKLRELFSKDSDICILPIKNYTMKNLKTLHEVFIKGDLRNAIKSSSVDVVHINSYTSIAVIQAFIYARMYKKKIIYSAHWHPFQTLNNPRFGKLFFNLFIKPLVHYFADVVFTINNEDTAFFKRINKNIVQIPHWLSVPVKTIVKPKIKNQILFVGRADNSNKGVEYLYLLPEGKYSIHCVGKGKIPYRSDITQHVNISKQDLDKLYEESSLLVVPSRYEAFSYVTMEALSFGTPVLLSDRVRIFDYLENMNGVNVFEYKNESDFIKKVESSIGQFVDTEYLEKELSSSKIKSKYRESILRLFGTL